MLEPDQPQAAAILAASGVVGLFPDRVMLALRALGRAAASRGFALLVTDYMGKNFMLANSAFPAQTHPRDPSLRSRTFAELSNGRFYKSMRFVVGGARATDAKLMAALDALASLETVEFAWDSLSDQWAHQGVIGMEAA